MQDAGLFEALVANSHGFMMARTKRTGPLKDTLSHRGKALKSLRLAITTSDAPVADAVIWTVILLLGIDVRRLLIAISDALILTLHSISTRTACPLRRT